VLVCPLNWGLGHAARDVPVIERLLEAGHEVILAGEGAPLDLLRCEFPELETVHFRSNARIRYSKHLPAWLKILFLSPFILYGILAEHFRLKRMIPEVRPDVVISDNRYGLWNRKVISILITHQLSIRFPGFAAFLEYPVHRILKKLIGQFDRCWIPDYPGPENLSGMLSHRYALPGNAVFIGAVSRFTGKPDHAGNPDNPEPFPESPPIKSPSGLKLLVLLSGPEPQRSRLQKIILTQVLSMDVPCVILLGLPGKSKRTDLSSVVTTYSHLPAAELRNLINLAENVVCRSGYTSIMDLALLKKKALLIPTPGQTEQEYLAEYLGERGMFLWGTQGEFELGQALKNLKDFNPLFNLPDKDYPGEELFRKI